MLVILEMVKIKNNRAINKSESFPIDYYRNPVLGRNSVSQLLQRSGLMGFSNLVWVSGDWRGLASPFCRIDREVPINIVCEPEYIAQQSEHAFLEAAFVGPDAIAIEISVSTPLRLFSGAPGKIYHNGGTAHQQWMAFDAFRDGARLGRWDQKSLLSSNGDYCAVFHAKEIHLAEDGNGWFMDLPVGITRLGVGVAFRSPETAAERALQSFQAANESGGLSRIRESLQEEWAGLFKRFELEEGLDTRTRHSAENAIWCMYSNLAAPEGFLKHPAVIGAKIQYPGVFPWDSAFASVALQAADPELAKSQIEIYTEALADSPDGNVGEMTALHSGGGVQFPLFSWAAWKVHSATSDLAFLNRIYKPLAKHAAWWLRSDGPHPGIPRYERVICLDDSPRFDMFSAEGRMSLREPVFGADLIAICAWDQMHLARIAQVLGHSEAASEHLKLAARLIDFSEDFLYDENLKRYIDKDVSGRSGIVDTPMNHFPGLFSPHDDRRRRAAEALSSKGPFWGQYGLATVSPKEASFDPCRIWRGPIWLSLNFLCANACAEAGFFEVADEIAKSSIALVCSNHPHPNGIMEYYNYMTGEGSGAHHIATMSAAPFLSFLQSHHHVTLGGLGNKFAGALGEKAHAA